MVSPELVTLLAKSVDLESHDDGQGYAIIAGILGIVLSAATFYILKNGIELYQITRRYNLNSKVDPEQFQMPSANVHDKEAPNLIKKKLRLHQILSGKPNDIPADITGKYPVGISPITSDHNFPTVPKHTKTRRG